MTIESSRSSQSNLTPYPRMRKKVLIPPYVITTLYEFNPSWTVATSKSWSWPVIGSYQVMNDIVTPGYKKLVAQGCIVNNPCSQYSMGLVPTSCNRTATYAHRYGTPVRTDSYVATWVNYLPMLDSPSWYAANVPEPISALQKRNLDSVAIIEAYKKLQTTSWELPVDLLELKKTVRMLGNYVQHFRGLIRYLRNPGKKPPRRRRNRRSRPIPPHILREIRDRLKKTADKTSEKTLEFLYGWLPLVMSIEDAIEAVGRLEPKVIRQTVSASVPIEANDTETDTTNVYVLGTGNGTLTITKTVAVHETYRARCGICASTSVTWRHVFGLTAWNAPEIIWELTTLSFVVDWFLKIGSWLTALKVRLEAHVEYSWLTQTSERESTQTFASSGCSCLRQNSATDYETYIEDAYQSTLVETVKTKVRTPNPPFPLLPPWSKDLFGIESLTHLCAGLALSYQALARMAK